MTVTSAGVRLTIPSELNGPFSPISDELHRWWSNRSLLPKAVLKQETWDKACNYCIEIKGEYGAAAAYAFAFLNASSPILQFKSQRFHAEAFVEHPELWMDSYGMESVWIHRYAHEQEHDYLICHAVGLWTADPFNGNTRHERMVKMIGRTSHLGYRTGYPETPCKQRLSPIAYKLDDLLRDTVPACRRYVPGLAEVTGCTEEEIRSALVEIALLQEFHQ